MNALKLCPNTQVDVTKCICQTCDPKGNHFRATRAPNPVYLALDPGETTGWATFDEKGILVAMGQFKMTDFHKEADRLITSDLLHVIVEDYRNHGFGRNKQKNWSRNQTSKNIGAIETYCTLRNVPLTLQPNTVKSIGYMWGGFSVPSNHAISHQFDAGAHGVYWLQSNGVRAAGIAIPKEDR